MVRTTTTCEISIIKQLNVKIINISLKNETFKGMTGRKGTLPCLIVEGDWNYMGRAEVFPQILKTAEGSN